MHNGIGRPLALIAGVVAAGAARPAVFQRPRRGDLLLCEHTGYLSRTVPGKAEVVYLLDYGCSFLVNNEIFVLEMCIRDSLIARPDSAWLKP